MLDIFVSLLVLAWTVTIGNCVTIPDELVGTWSSKSNAVFTGPVSYYMLDAYFSGAFLMVRTFMTL